jgi:CP family cyanate transporter-like MFS transporter
VRTARVSLWRDRRAWAVTLFVGVQSLIFYTAGAWLPEILRARSDVSTSTAGALLSLTMVVGTPVGFATATLASRMRDQRPLAVAAAICPALGWAGLLALPGTLTLLWVVLLGIGSGVGFTLVLTLFVLRARDVAHTEALSGMAQSAGYTLAAIGPLAIGALHDLTGGWTVPLVVLTALALPELIVAVAASRPGYVGEAPEPLAVAAAPAEGRIAA